MADDAPWYEALEEPVKNHVTNRGLDKKTAAEAAQDLAKAHLAAQHFIGAKPEDIVKLPKDATDPSFAKLAEHIASLSAPKDPAEYKFDGIKFKDGTELPADLAETIRAVAAGHKLPANLAPEFAKAFIGYIEKVEAHDAETGAATKAANEALLRQTWGADYDLNSFRVKRVTDALGWDQDVLNGIQNAAGGTKMMSALLGLAEKMSEPAFAPSGGNTGGAGGYTREQAAAKKAELMQNAKWREEWYNGDQEKRELLQSLDRIIVGAPAQRERY